MSLHLTTKIVVNLQIPGLHQWIQCPLEDVAYLRDLHRHVFHIRVVKKVNHNERDVEIILFKQSILEYLTFKFDQHKDGSFNFGNRSCETLAQMILEQFDCVEVGVLEDGENGAIVTKNFQ